MSGPRRHADSTKKSDAKFLLSDPQNIPLVVQTVKNLHETQVGCLGWEDSPGEGNGLPTPVFLPGKFHGQRSL